MNKLLTYFNKLYKKDINSFNEIVKGKLKKEEKTFIVTANPETFTIGIKDLEFDKLLSDEKTILVPDGIGIVKASHILGINVKERITGIDLALKLLEYGNELGKTIFFFGAKQEVIDSLINVVNKEYPNLKIVGSENGYAKDKDEVFDTIANLKPDIILVAMGIPLQEKLIYRNLSKFEKGIFVGVGGSFDVISGHKKRAPKIFIKLNLEWLYRIIKEPKRIKRFYDNNIKFLFKISKLKKEVINHQK